MQRLRTANRQTPRTSRTGLTIVAVGWVALLWGLSTPAWADAVTDYNLALQWYKQGRWELAVEACRDFLKKYPADEHANSARLYLGQALVHLRDFEGARDEFRRFLRDAPRHQDRPLAAYRVGESSYFLNDLPAAQNELRSFLTTYPKHQLSPWALLYLGETEFRLKRVDVARQLFA
ncbi:Cell division coordinator CpoB (ORF2), partial [Durusdinium trenchii]